MAAAAFRGLVPEGRPGLHPFIQQAYTEALFPEGAVDNKQQAGISCVIR